MENQITIIQPSEIDVVIKNSGLQIIEGEEIKGAYQPFLNQLAELQRQAIEKINFENPTAIDETIAREIRLKVVKVRTGSNGKKDDRNKMNILKQKLEVTSDRLISISCQITEEVLNSVEKAREIAEKARKEQLKIERTEKLTPYCENISLYPLGEFTNQQFDELFNGMKNTYDQKIETEKQAEIKRLKLIEEERAENERIRLENEKLKKETELKEKQLETERLKAEQERKAVEEKNRIEREKQDAILKAEREKAENEAKKKQAEFDAKQKADQLEREKLQKELEVKEENERIRIELQRDIERAKELANLKAAKAPDKVKIERWVKSIEYGIPKECENLSPESMVVINDIQKKFIAFREWAIKQIEQI